MKRNKIIFGTMVGVLTTFLLPVLVGAQVAELSFYEDVLIGRRVFEESCGTCHLLKLPLALTQERSDWEKKVDTMIADGAEIKDEDAAHIVTFLASKSLFELKCAICHDRERCLSKNKNPEEWLRTVKKMSLKVEGGIARLEADSIASYLAVVCPPK